MTEKNILDLIFHGSEERNLEYKNSMPWENTDAKRKITKAAMAMSNIKDGGVIILGVKELSYGKYEPVGMPSDDANSFDQDKVSEYVNAYADPFVDLKVDRIEHDGKFFVVIQVKEFEEIPIICKKDDSGILRRGEIYTRSRKKYESVIVPSQTEMREILEMAIEKRMRKRVEEFFKIGIIRVSSPEDQDIEKFKKQLGEL
jgi:predicted HTH transcriptional regulator